MPSTADSPVTSPSGDARAEGVSFWPSDWIAAAIVTVVSLGLYVYTLMPNVGLQDSGELVTAAALFGVPHPPSYPLWSLCGFILTELLPIGNYAWRINLLSALFSSGTCAVLTLLVAASSRWLLARSLPEDRKVRATISFYGATAAGLILAFSDVIWAQGVIAEVYTLNAFLLLLTLLSLFRWIVAPEKRRWLLAATFFYLLGVTNHPTMLCMLPAFPLLVFLVHYRTLSAFELLAFFLTAAVCLIFLGPLALFVLLFVFNNRFFYSFLIGFNLLIVTAFGVLAWYSQDDAMRSIAARVALGDILLLGFLAFWHLREFRRRKFLIGALGTGLLWIVAGQWIGGWFAVSGLFGLILFFLACIAAGLLTSSTLDWPFALAMVLFGWAGLMIFAKTPISSKTNPPMNWSYASESRGLYQSIIRGQYGNNLAATIKNFVGPLTGYHAPNRMQNPNQDSVSSTISYVGIVMSSIKMYGRSLEDNFTLPVTLLVFALVLYFHHLDVRQRPWVYFMIVSFFLLAFMLTFVDTPQQLDRASWLAIKPFHILSHCLFVLGIGYGIVSGLLYLYERAEGHLPLWTMAGALFISIATLQANIVECNQRGHWFGWQYGIDMLRTLPKGAIVYGGTDPGRFVPTYMIFCESQQPARYKRDPSFDRSDLYIITQNALADLAYVKYIRDHYDDRFRPKAYTAFEKWLGRDRQFPQKSLHLLDDDEFNVCYARYVRETPNIPITTEEQSTLDIFRLNGVIAREIFEANKKDHAFYVEESLPIDWMYPYMTPEGLLLRLNPEPTALTPEIIARDRQFWDDYTARLLANPYLRDDLDAEKSFSKLRNSIGNLYRARDRDDEALYAYRQALTIAPDNAETADNCFRLLLSLDRFDEAQKVAEDGARLDPHNPMYRRMLQGLRRERDLAQQIKEIQTDLATSPRDFQLRLQESELLGRRHDIGAFKKSLRELVTFHELTHAQFTEYMKYLGSANEIDFGLELLALRVKVDPDNADLLYNYAALSALKGKTADSLRLLTKTLKIGGSVYATTARTDSRFHSLSTNATFLKLTDLAPR